MTTALDQPADTMAAAFLLIMAALLWSAKRRKADRAPILDPLTGLLDSPSLEFRRREIEQQSVLTREPVGVVFSILRASRGSMKPSAMPLAADCLSDVADRLRSGLREYESIYRLGAANCDPRSRRRSCRCSSRRKRCTSDCQ